VYVVDVIGRLSVSMDEMECFKFWFLYVAVDVMQYTSLILSRFRGV
jgi:hypothetical protein